ncbi:MAG: hypothetical protein EXS63_05495 [Candidatus Omnitrophica bacterium]|nr:hypothetical protein [Candidatus Omnitrophota bacterium]
MAKDKVFVRPASLEISGTGCRLQYRRTIGSHRKTNGHFRIYGNIIMNRTANTADYANDRSYGRDPNLKYFRPPGIPVRPELRTVRES